MDILSLVTSGHSKFYQQEAAGLRDRGHTVETIAVSAYADAPEAGSGRRSPAAYARYYPRVLAAASGSFDLVHANFGLTAPPAVLQPFHPVVLSLWGTDLMGEYGWLSRFCARFAEATVVMSEDMAERLGADCHVIPHGVDLERFQPVPQLVARDAVGWDPDARHVLFPYGTGRAVKDYPRAERVVELARSDFDGRIELQTMSGVPHERVPWYMNAADAMLLTSKREGSPNTVKEAMACNLPVVAAAVGDVARRLEGVSHSTVADDDAALADGLVATLRAGERSDGRAAIADLSQDRQVDRLERLMRSVAGEEPLAGVDEPVVDEARPIPAKR